MEEEEEDVLAENSNNENVWIRLHVCGMESTIRIGGKAPVRRKELSVSDKVEKKSYDARKPRHK